MSFLNALASDGLSVGLRFYTAKMSRASEMAAAPMAAKPEDGPSLRAREAEQLAKPAPPPPPPKEATPEELAAGRSEAQAMLAADGSLGLLQASAAPPAEEPEESEESDDPEAEGEGEDGEKSAAGKDLSEEEQKQVQDMKKRDQEVRTHEQAHMSAGGGLAGSASYEYQTGPDGQKYAVGGEVPISTRGGGTPEQQLRDAETVKRAAMAPAEPSGQDRSVASQASADINRLRGEVAEARREETEGGQTEEGQAEEAGNPESASAKPAGGQKAEEQAVRNGAAQPDPTAMYGKKMDGPAIAAPKRLASNGESFGSHVLSAYATAKFGYFNGGAARPVLARA